MAMPKGYKSTHGYATVATNHDGMDYRKIAEKMSGDGYVMNHATARNVFLRAMKKLAQPICGAYGISSEVEVERTARDPRFQEGMVEIVSGIYSDIDHIDI